MDCTMDYHEVLGLLSGRHPQASGVTRTPSEKQFSYARCLGWKTKNSTNCTQRESQRGKSKNIPGGLKKEPASWSYTSGGTTRREEQKKLTHLSLSSTLHPPPPPPLPPTVPTSSQLARCTPQSSSATGTHLFPPQRLRSGRSASRHMTTPPEAVGEGSLVGADNGRRLFGSLDGTTRLGPAQDGTEPYNEPVSPTQPCRFESKQRRPT